MSVEPGYLEHLATNRYFDRTFDCDAVKVLPGEYFVTTSDILLVTVLGSCVTACIRDRDKGLGGMNHFMLPQMNKGQHADEDVLLAGDASPDELRHAEYYLADAEAFIAALGIDATCSLVAVGTDHGGISIADDGNPERDKIGRAHV